MHPRNIILLVNEAYMPPLKSAGVAEALHHLINRVITTETLCQTLELVTRSSITQKRARLIKALQEPALKPFWFLINKN